MTAASRRTVLAALAAAPAAGVPALADVADAGEPDSIFALIDAAKLALKALEAHDEATLETKDDAALEKGCALNNILRSAEDGVFTETPSTRAGLAAQLMFAAEFLAKETACDEDGPDYDDHTILLPMLLNAARMIDKPTVQKIVPSEWLAKILSFVDQPENES